MNIEHFNLSDSSKYIQFQRILRIYSDFSYMETDEKTIYHQNPYHMLFVTTHKFQSMFVYDTLCKNIANLCRVIRLFTVGNKTTVANPFMYNGIQLMEMCLRGHKLNCAGCSIVLNDILITLGYRSKCVCCIPYNAQDIDTHVLVHVYNETTKDWFVADPALGYVPCDKNGGGMDLLFLRNYLASEEKLYFYQYGKIIKESEKCFNYAGLLIKNMFMYIIFQNSGLNYSFENSRMIVPSGVSKISNMYKISEKTNNSFYLYN